MSDPGLRKRLLDAELPDEAGARARGWRVVQAAYVERRPLRADRRRRRSLALAVASAAVVLAVVLSPAGAKVIDAIRSATGIGDDHARPALTALPTSGALAVDSALGPWVVHQDGSKRLLGDYSQATWSPHGLYLAVANGPELAASTPTGDVRWTISESSPVRDPRWSTSGVRVAFRSGGALHVAAGDGTSDVVIDHTVGAVPPAWRPIENPTPTGIVTGPRTNLLAYVDADHSIVLIDTDTGEVLSRSTPQPVPFELTWSSNGRRLLAVTRHGLYTYGLDLQQPTEAGFERNQSVRDAEFVPGSKQVVATIDTRSGGRVRSEVRYGRTDVEAFLHDVLYSGVGRLTDVQPSPDGSWVLVGWPAADQWLFIRLGDAKVRAVKNISEQFDPGATSPSSFPRIAGWCCAP